MRPCSRSAAQGRAQAGREGRLAAGRARGPRPRSACAVAVVRGRVRRARRRVAALPSGRPGIAGNLTTAAAFCGKVAFRRAPVGASLREQRHDRQSQGPAPRQRGPQFMDCSVSPDAAARDGARPRSLEFARGGRRRPEGRSSLLAKLVGLDRRGSSGSHRPWGSDPLSAPRRTGPESQKSLDSRRAAHAEGRRDTCAKLRQSPARGRTQLRVLGIAPANGRYCGAKLGS
jgi:hypothetical protein